MRSSGLGLTLNDRVTIAIRAAFGFACVLAMGPVLALEITNVRLERAMFDPSKGELGEVKFQLDSPATIELRLFDGREMLIRKIQSEELPAGDHAMTWNGKDAAGKPVPSEAYQFTLFAKSSDGETATSDLSDATGGEQMVVRDAVWDPESGSIRFRLSKTARVNIRVGLQDNGPLLRTVVDWVARPAGDNVQIWDGWDGSHVLDLAHHPKLSVFVDAYALSDNTFLVAPLADQVNLIEKISWKKEQRPDQVVSSKLMHEHSQQPIEERSDLQAIVTIPEANSVASDGAINVSGRVTLRLDVAEKDRERVIRQRFEPVFFVDGTFAFESEVGYLPFSWIWDTTTANEGIHYVTVNVRGYEGNFGMATLKVNVQRAAERGSQP